MPKFLSQEWLDLQKATANSFVDGSDKVSAVVQFVVEDTKYFWNFQDGKLLVSELGTVDNPEITISISLTDAVEMQKGTLSPSVAFMQGRMKIAGDMTLAIRLLAFAATSGYSEWQEKLRTDTEY